MRKQMMTVRIFSVRSVVVATAAVMAAGCAVQPHAFTRDQLHSIAAQDKARVSTEVPQLQGELSLSEAIARALKYNLDHRTKILEQAYAAGALEAAYYDLLPKLVASVDYSSRDNDPIRRSQDSITGSLDQSHPFISSDRSHTLTGLGLSWNMLDFGVSYFNAKQQADRVLIASERRRKTMHELVRSVEAAYWRALSAQKLHDKVSATIKDAESALTDARKVENERLKAPAESLRYQRALLENLRTLESVQQEMAVAQMELAGLVNLPAGRDYRLSEPSGNEQLPQLTAQAEQLEAVAIANNPDLREENYNARIAALETRKALVRLLPGISLDYGYQHDTDSYLINKSWTEAGVQVSANLLNAFSYHSQKKLGKAGERLAETRRMALQMAVVTQVHIAAQQFEGAREQFERADDIWRVDDRMQSLIENGESARTESKLTGIASRTSAILSLLRRYQALSNLHAAAGRVQATLGLEPQIGSLDDISLQDLTRKIEASFLDWQKVQSPTIDAKTNAG